MTELVITGLVILLLASNLLWGLHSHKLLNKIMSRNFYEYQQSRTVPKRQEQELAEALNKVKIPVQTHPNELDSLDEMIKQVMPLG